MDTQQWEFDERYEINYLEPAVRCSTTHFKAAVQFKRYADKRAMNLLDRAFVKHYEAPLRPLPRFLDPHQKEGVHWILTRSRSYLAHAPGAGKTWEAVTAAILAQGEGQTVVIVPPSLTVNWAREIERICRAALANLDTLIFPTLSTIPVSKDRHTVDWNADFLIVPDSMLTKAWVLEHLIPMKIKLLAVDEASRFKESTTERAKALFGGPLKDGSHSPGLIYDARHAVLMDGSPMPNRSMELWAPTFAMSPESIDFMSQQDFGFRYCGAKMNDRGQWEFKGDSRQDELRIRLQKHFMHVVTEDQLSHPERRRSILFMNEDPRSLAHKAWEKSNLSKISLADLSEEASQGKLAEFRHELGLRKIPWIVNYVNTRLDKNESVLLFAWHRDVCEELFNNFIDLAAPRAAMVIGGTKEADRERYFEKFQEGKIKLIIGNIAAMGRGHNLQRADRVVFGEYSWTDELNKQCEKRTSRRGNEKLFTPCDYIAGPDTMDEPVLNAIFRKAANVKRVIG